MYVAQLLFLWNELTFGNFKYLTDFETYQQKLQRLKPEAISSAEATVTISQQEYGQLISQATEIER